MLFNSYIFIFLFFPVCFAGFWFLAPKRGGFPARLWLIGFSLWFYAYYNVRYFAFLIAGMCLNYAAHCLILKQRGRSAGGVVFAATSIADIAALGYFKYSDFFISSVNSAFHTDLVMKSVILPLGISFFIFQQIYFIGNTFRGKTGKCSAVDYVLFSSFFPTVSAGPITTCDEMLPQFDGIGNRHFSGEGFARGFVLFVLGLSKKVLLADRIGTGVDYGWDNQSFMQGKSCFILMLLYSAQLYFDFSGYCDMGRGIAQMLGMDLPVNFNSPYKAVNIIDFWKRWHITLNRFFRDNLYIPLGGNRKGRKRTYVNLFLVFLVSGLWHGAGWNYIFWGILHGAAYVATKIYLDLKRGRQKCDAGYGRKYSGREEISGRPVYSVIKHALAVTVSFLYVSFAWIYFRAPSVAAGSAMIARMFDGYPLVDRGLGRSFNTGLMWYAVKMLHLDGHGISDYLIMYVYLAVSLAVIFLMKNAAETAKKMKLNAVTAFVCAVLFVCCVLSLSKVSAFIYYKF